MPRPISSTAFVIHYALIIGSFDTVNLKADLLKTPLHKERTNKLTTVIRVCMYVCMFAVDFNTCSQ
jgi:hypothetical protein